MLYCSDGKHKKYIKIPNSILQPFFLSLLGSFFLMLKNFFFHPHDIRMRVKKRWKLRKTNKNFFSSMLRSRGMKIELLSYCGVVFFFVCGVAWWWWQPLSCSWGYWFGIIFYCFPYFCFSTAKRRWKTLFQCKCQRKGSSRESWRKKKICFQYCLLPYTFLILLTYTNSLRRILLF